MGVQTDTATLEISMSGSQKISKQSTSTPSNTTFFLYTKNAQLYHKGMRLTMFIAALFVKARIWKQPKCPSSKELLKKMWYVYTMEYYTEVKKK